MWWILYGRIRVPDALKPLHTQFQGTGTNLYFSKNRRVDPQEYIIQNFNCDILVPHV